MVASPWTNYDTNGKEHLSCSHHWRPQGGGIYGGEHLTAGLHLATNLASFAEQSAWELDCEAWWEQHWERIGAQLRSAPEGSVSLLVTHSPPHLVLGGPPSSRSADL